jgi:RNA-directed DNA polymerase
MAAEGVVGERVAEDPNKKPRVETQISMNGKDAGISEEKPESYSRDSGRNLPRVECCERPTVTAKREDTIQETASLMEAVLERENMKAAYARVVGNKGAPGVDRMTVGDLKAHLTKHWLQIKDELMAGRYEPSPVKQVEIPKPDGGVRKLGIPTVTDRLIQQALHQVLSPIFESNFSESSYGFRPGKNAHQAVLKAREYIAGGRKWVVDIDLEKFFDRVNHDILMSRVARKIKDKKVLLLIRKYLQAGIMIEGIESPREEGTPQGGPLSPLLSNILLDDLDKELEERGHKFCRYADDCNIYVKLEEAGQRVMASVKRYLEERLKLRVNDQKSQVARPWKRKFLGYTVTHGKPRIRIAEKTINKMKDKVRDKLQQGKSLARAIKELNPLLKGWINYFKLTEVGTILERLDEWIRRKFRKIIWKQLKNPRTRMRALMKQGVRKEEAWSTANSRKGAWRCSRTQAMHQGYPNSYFEEMGLVSLHREKMCL